jgi:hypothetical protein
MRISDTYNQGKALKAADISQPVLKTIDSVTAETIGQGPAKPVAKFTDGTRLILNQFNAFELAGWYGDDTAGWKGKQVELYTSTTMYQGNPVPCIRVRRPAAPSTPAVSAPVPQAAPKPAPSPVVPKQSPAAPLSYQKQVDLLGDVDPPPF